MELIYRTAFGLCVTAAISGFISYLAPKKTLHTAMSFVLRLFFLASLCFCVTGIEPQELSLFPEEERNSSSYEEMEMLVQNQVAESFRENIRVTVEEILGQYGVSDAKVEVTVHITEQNIIMINNIRIHSDAVIPGEALHQVENTLGVAPEVIS